MIARRALLPLAVALLSASFAAVEPTVEVDILTLTSIEWKPGDPLPEQVTELSGKRVVIRVTGDFEVGEVLDDWGYVASLYRMSTDKVEQLW